MIRNGTHTLPLWTPEHAESLQLVQSCDLDPANCLYGPLECGRIPAGATCAYEDSSHSSAQVNCLLGPVELIVDYLGFLPARLCITVRTSGQTVVFVVVLYVVRFPPH